jgi:hypothetical protein
MELKAAVGTAQFGEGCLIKLFFLKNLLTVLDVGVCTGAVVHRHHSGKILQ